MLSSRLAHVDASPSTFGHLSSEFPVLARSPGHLDLPVPVGSFLTLDLPPPIRAMTRIGIQEINLAGYNMQAISVVGDTSSGAPSSPRQFARLGVPTLVCRCLDLDSFLPLHQSAKLEVAMPSSGVCRLGPVLFILLMSNLGSPTSTQSWAKLDASPSSPACHVDSSSLLRSPVWMGSSASASGCGRAARLNATISRVSSHALLSTLRSCVQVGFLSPLPVAEMSSPATRRHDVSADLPIFQSFRARRTRLQRRGASLRWSPPLQRVLWAAWKSAKRST